jgi:type IV pilus assembly protein PilV
MARIPFPAATRADQRGTTMIEVLVAIVIVVFGLLGLAGLQSRASVAEMESFQRAQALLLMQDMVDRINSNRKNAASYATSTPLGTGNPAGACNGLSGMALDKCQWNNALLGAAESAAGGATVGAMIGARGCVEVTNAAMPRKVQVSVVWQGLTTTAKSNVTACGTGAYDAADKKRRVVSTSVTIGCLQNNPVSLVCVTP